VLFYRIRQRKCIDMDAMWAALAKIDFVKLSGFGWCYKAAYRGKPVDCFFPEGERDADGNEVEYVPGEPDPVVVVAGGAGDWPGLEEFGL